MGELRSVDLRDMGGSWVSFLAGHQLDRNQAPKSDNVDPTRSALSAMKRRGYAKHSRVFAAPSGTKISGLFRWIMNDGTAWSLATEGTKVWNYTSSAETDRTGATTLTSDALTSFTAFNNTLILAHGGTPQVWDGVAATFSNLGGSPPSDLIAVATHIGRVWGIRKNSSVAAFSAIDNPADWTTADNAGTINVDKSDGDTLTAIVSTDNILYLFKRNSVHTITGTSVDNFARRKIWEEGATNINAVRRVGHYVFFASDNAVFMINGAEVSEITPRIQGTYLNLSTHNTVALGRLRSHQVWVSVDEDNDGVNDAVYVLDFRRGAWARYTGMNVRCFANLEDGALIGGKHNAVLAHKFDTGTNDDGAAISMVRDTPDLYNPKWHLHKAFKAFWLLSEKTGAASITVQAAFDGDTTSLTTLTPTLAPGSGTGLVFQRYAMPNRRVKFARFRISNSTLDEEVSLHGYGCEYEDMEGTT